MEKATKTKTESETKTSAAKSTEQAKKPVYQKVALVIAIIAGVALIALYILMGMEDSATGNPTAVEEEVIDANCAVTECITQIETSDSVEKITEIIGVEPEVDETSGTAKWKLSSKESIAREKSGSSYILQATIDKTKIASNDVNFSIFSELKKDLESGESFTYDELVQKLGGVAGTLAGKTDTSKRYTWVDGHDQTLSATFSDKTGKCSIISLR